MKYTKEQVKNAMEHLRETIKPGDKLYTLVTHVARSGMSRSIRVFDSNHQDITWYVARVEDERIDDKNGGLRVSGCGMDMGFSVVYNLGYILFPDGFECIGQNCPSSDHSNGDRDYTPHAHKSGGYALRQSWL